MAGEEALNTLLRVAYTHFIVNGVEGASMQTIAREAGVSRQMIHNRFGNKQQFFDEVVRLGDNHMASRFKVDTVRQTNDPWIVFGFFGNQIFDVMVDPGYIDIFRVMNVAAYRHPEIGAGHGKALNKAYAMFARHLIAAGDELGVEVEDPKGSARDFLALIHGLALPVIQGRRARPTSKVQNREIDAIVRRFLRGLGFGDTAGGTPKRA